MNNLQRKLAYLIQEIRSSYWFVPGVMVIFAFLLALFSIEMDRSAPEKLIESLSWLFTDDPEAARVILSTIATATMGVAGVTFSMTLLSISFAASQIGPRILSGFMRDRGNQVSLGVFIATFVYCIMVLRTVYSPEEGGAFVPNLSIVFALVFAVLSIFVLIYFINHIPMMMSMTNSVNRTGKQLISSIELQFPKKMGDGSVIDEFKVQDKGERTDIKARGMGYIEYINYEILMEVCENEDLLVEVVKRPGDFVSKEITIAYAYSSKSISEKIKKEISDTFIEGINRSYQQDIRFPGNLLIEIAARALSPGVNDPFTAIDCMNQLQTGLLFMQGREVPSKYRLSKDSKIRVISEPILYREFLLHVLNSLRNFVKRDFLCSKHMLGMISVLSEKDCDNNKEVYMKQSHQLVESFKNNSNDKIDIEIIETLELT